MMGTLKLFFQSEKGLLIGTFIISCLLLQSLQISGDGFSYYAYLRSILFDGDLEFTNEFTDYNPLGHATPDPTLKTPTGRAGNPYAVGPAILWSPFAGVVHLATKISGAEVTGYEWQYVAAVTCGTNFYALLGLLALYKICRRYINRLPALLGIMGISWGTALIHYLYFEPSYAHVMSAAWVAIFLATYLHFRDAPTSRNLILVGVAGGIMMLTRWQNALFWIIPAVELLATLLKTKNEERRSYLVEKIYAWGKIGLIALVVFLPQILVWRHLYGRWFTVPMGSSFIQWQPKILWEILVSPRNGLFSWTPLVLVGFIGLLFLYRRDKWLAIGAGVGLVAQWILNASIVDWWGGAAFGGRRFIECSPFLALGLASLLQWATKNRVVWRVALAALWFFVVWNLAMWTQYAIGTPPIQTMTSLPDIYQAQLTDGLPNLPRLLGRSTWLDWLVREGILKGNLENILKAGGWPIALVFLAGVVMTITQKLRYSGTAFFYQPKEFRTQRESD